MKHFMYGYDRKDPAACAKMLRNFGIDAVISGQFDPDAVCVFQEAGMGLYLCYGAHSVRNGETVSQLARDPVGAEQRWFGSACPNAASISQERLRSVLAEAEKIPGLKGIFVDGARFASFASAEGPAAFFTCFCPRCMEKMQQLGMDGEKIRQAVSHLQKNPEFCPEETPLLRQWLRFREQCVQEYMERFAQAVHEKNPHWRAGAFIFPPSLGEFVGQSMRACASLDILSPMLYRAYAHEQGPACMNHEWAAFYCLLGKKAAAFRQLSPICLHPEGEITTPEEILKRGFSPEDVAQEVREAVKGARPGQMIAPIIQLEDGRLKETAGKVLAAQAHGVGYFAYGVGQLPENP